MSNAVAKQTVATVKSWMELKKDEIAAQVPRHLDPDRMISVLTGVLSTSPKLQECTPVSLFHSMIMAAQMGLQVNQFNSCFLIPYGDEAKLIVGYQGLIDLARRGGGLKAVHVKEVYDNESFNIDETGIQHTPLPFGPKGELQGVYCILELGEGFKQWEVMNLDEIEVIRSQARSGNSPAWKNNYVEMCKKTVVRRAVKKLPLNPEVMQHMSTLDEQEFKPKVREVEKKDLGGEGLMDRLVGDDVTFDGETGEVVE